ncbi:hypothetical protein CKK21_26345, partial [Enterobacter cloacae]
AVQLEQYCMDTLLPDLNVDPVASSSGYHEPMSHTGVIISENYEVLKYLFMIFLLWILIALVI